MAPSPPGTAAQMVVADAVDSLLVGVASLGWQMGIRRPRDFRPEGDRGTMGYTYSSRTPLQRARASISGGTNLGADFTADEIELGRAMEEWKTVHHNRYPTTTDVLEVIFALGYRQRRRGDKS